MADTLRPPPSVRSPNSFGAFGPPLRPRPLSVPSQVAEIDAGWMDPNELEPEPGEETRPHVRPPRRPSERATVPSLASAVSSDDSTLELGVVSGDESVDDGEPVFDLMPPPQVPEMQALLRIPRPHSEPGLAELARSLNTPGPSREPRPRTLFGAAPPQSRPTRRSMPAFVLSSTEPPRTNTPKLPPPRTPVVMAPPAGSGPPHTHSGVDFAAFGRTVPPAGAGLARRFAIPLIASHLAVAAAVGLFAMRDRLLPHKPLPERRAAAGSLTPLATTVAPPPPRVPVGACAANHGSRVVASRAQVGPGLEVTALETGFGIGIASSNQQAVGVRVEGSRLRVAETVRVKVPAAVQHVAIDSREDESDGLDVHVDVDDARTIIGGGDAPPFRIVARGAQVLGLTEDGRRSVPIWALPAVARTKPAAATAAASTSGDVLRAAAREDGGAVVALRRPGALWLGVADSSLTPEGPLVPLARKATTLGTPAVAPLGGGGVVTWAERAPGAKEWSVHVSVFAPDGEGATLLGAVRSIGAGMSPTIATLPDGDLLLAYATGGAGAHRVVAQRLGRDLAPRGDLVMVSPETMNAGQPVAAVRSDGRALVAYFAADRGRSGAAVVATSLDCDPGL